MSLQTPVKIRTLQRKLYCKAKAEPEYRFYLLYDKVWRADVLAHAWALAKANGGASGVDGATFAGIEAAGSRAHGPHSVSAHLRRYRDTFANNELAELVPGFAANGLHADELS